MEGTLWTLMVSTVLIGGLHALAPDHWIPMVNLSTANGWSAKKTMRMTCLAGLGHVSSSILIGGIGVLLGYSVGQINWVEGQRGQLAGWLLIGFGVAYALWGFRHWAKHHRHHHEHDHNRSGATLIAVLVIGPCEPLVPLLFLAWALSGMAVWMVIFIFTLTTLSMMVVQVRLATMGISRSERLRQILASPITAGLCIAATGVIVMAFGL